MIWGLPYLNRRYTKLLKYSTASKSGFPHENETMMITAMSKVTFRQKPNMKGWSMRIFFPLGGQSFYLQGGWKMKNT